MRHWRLLATARRLPSGLHFMSRGDLISPSMSITSLCVGFASVQTSTSPLCATVASLWLSGEKATAITTSVAECCSVLPIAWARNCPSRDHSTPPTGAAGSSTSNSSLLCPTPKTESRPLASKKTATSSPEGCHDTSTFSTGSLLLRLYVPTSSHLICDPSAAGMCTRKIRADGLVSIARKCVLPVSSGQNRL
eukprot:3406948-Rhodomonas_salina.1